MTLGRLVVLTIFLSVGPTVRLSAQCPDGSAPPCNSSRSTPVAGPNSIAVLYFDNLTRDSTYAYLADGLTEELISRLGQIRRLDVRSRHESRRVRGGRLSPVTFGRTLNVAYVLSGSVQTGGSRLRVTAELTRSSTGARVWGDVIDRTGANALDIQTEIATAVTSAVIGQLLPSERTVLVQRGTRNSAAYDLYLRGRFLVNTYDQAGIRLGMDLYREALAHDSTFAGAYAGLAEGWQLLADNSVPPRVAMSQARAAAERAISIDSTIGLAYVSLGTWAMQLEFDYARAESLARRAIAVDGHLAEGYKLLGHALLLQGKNEEAMAATDRAWHLDSLSNTIGIEYLSNLYYAGRFTDALAVAKRIQRRGPTGGRIASGLEAFVLLTRRECVAAREVIEAVPPSDRTPRAVVALALVAACLGQRDEAAEMLRYLETQSRTTYVRATYIADIHAALGNVDESFAALERAYDARDWNVFHLLLPAHVWWREPLRADPRFQSLVQRMNLSEPR